MIKRISELKNKISPQEKKKLGDKLQALLKLSYFTTIPLQDIQNLFSQEGYALVNEDGTPFGGMLLGEDSSAMIEFKRTDDMFPFSNAVLKLSWYKMPSPSKKYEITGYLS